MELIREREDLEATKAPGHDDAAVVAIPVSQPLQKENTSTLQRSSQPLRHSTSCSLGDSCTAHLLPIKELVLDSSLLEHSCVHSPMCWV